MDNDVKKSYLETYSRLFPAPETFLQLFFLANQTKDKKALTKNLTSLFLFDHPFETYMLEAKRLENMNKDYGLNEIATIYTAWLNKSEFFKQTSYEPFMAILNNLKAQLGINQR